MEPKNDDSHTRGQGPRDDRAPHRTRIARLLALGALRAARGQAAQHNRSEPEREEPDTPTTRPRAAPRRRSPAEVEPQANRRLHQTPAAAPQ